MAFENFVEQSVDERVEKAKESAPSINKENLGFAGKSEGIRQFIEGEIDRDAFEQLLKGSADHEGRVYFETLPEFILAVRRLVKDKEEADEILDHENAHALEAAQRGYTFRYFIDFKKDEKNLLLLKIKKIISTPGVDLTTLDKFGERPDDAQLVEDLVAIGSAPEALANRALSDNDKHMLGRESSDTK